MSRVETRHSRLHIDGPHATDSTSVAAQSPRPNPFVSVIIPAYNEEGIIEVNVREVLRYLQTYAPEGRTVEVVVVDDGSTDATASILDQMAMNDDRVTVIHHPRNMGRGRALRNGLMGSRGDYIVAMDADLSYTPDHIARLVDPLVADSADMTLASAWHLAGSVENVPLFRRLLSRFGNKLLKAAQHGQFSTMTCMVRAYRRDVLEHLVLVSDGKDLNLEVLLKAELLRYRIMEVPAVLRWRNTQRTEVKKGLSLSSLQTNSMSHLFYCFLYFPSAVLLIPTLLAGVSAAVGALLTVRSFSLSFQRLYENHSLTHSVYAALRQIILEGPVLTGLFSLAFVVFLIFLSLILLAQQSKHYFGETYYLLSQMQHRLRRLEAEQS